MSTGETAAQTAANDAAAMAAVSNAANDNSINAPNNTSLSDTAAAMAAGTIGAGVNAPSGGIGAGNFGGDTTGTNDNGSGDAAAAAAAAAGMNGGNSNSGGGGGGGGKIICTKLHELGKMPKEIYEADQAFGARLVKISPQTYDGYACWAQHVVRWMSRDDWFGKVVVFAAYHIATPWSKAMAEEMGVNVKSSWFGRLLMKQGLRFCSMIGQMNQNRSVQNV